MATTLCPRCFFRTLSRPLHSTKRPFHTTVTLSSAKAIDPNLAQTSTPQRSPPAVTSTAAAQPFSAPLTPSGMPPDILAEQKEQRNAPRKVVSSVPAGTPLLGINYLKNQEDPVAMEDEEYPEWLWRVLDKKESTIAQKEEVDPKLFSKSTEQRRRARKRLKERQLANPETLVPKTPIYEQTIDLPSNEVKAAADAREQLNRAMRSKRRHDIKESNFLQEMR